jgi:DNA replication and repair protein RecF
LTILAEDRSARRDESAPPAHALPGPAAAGSTGAGRLGIVRLTVADFRSYRRARLDCGPAPVVLTGPNGAGKTNLLEAISFLAPGRGLRAAALAEPDRRENGTATPLHGRAPEGQGSEGRAWAVSAVLATATGPLVIGTGREAERRVVRIDGAARGGQKELAERLSVVWLTPEMDRIFVEAPKARRRLLDRLVYGFHPEHAAAVASYEHCARERMRLLGDGVRDDAWLAALEDGMARHGIALAAARRLTVERLDRAAAAGWPQFPRARLAMAGEVDRWIETMPALAAEERLRAGLAAAREGDAAAGKAQLGPQRSDLAVHEATRGLPAARGSTGEQKALLLSLMLGFVRALTAERGAPPILLLDEVAAHLDRARRAALFDALSDLGCQAWLTGTDEEVFGGLAGRAHFFRVLDAAVTASTGPAR